MKRSSHSRPLEALESVKIRRWTSSSCRSSVWKWVCTHGGCGAAVPWAVLPMQCNPPCCAAMSSTRKAQDGIKSDLNFKMPRSWLVFTSWLSRFHKHHQFAVKLAICTILDDLLGLIEQQLFFFFFHFFSEMTFHTIKATFSAYWQLYERCWKSPSFVPRLRLSVGREVGF